MRMLLSTFLLLTACASAGGGEKTRPPSKVSRGQAPGSRPAEASTLPGPSPGFLRQYALTYRFRLGRPGAIEITPKGEAVLFLRSGPRSFVQDLWSYDVEHKRERRLLSAADLVAEGRGLDAVQRARLERQRISGRGITSYRLCRDGKQLLVPVGGRLFVVERASRKAMELKSKHEGAPIDPRFSPGGERLAYVRRGDLYLYDLRRRRERRLTRREAPEVDYGLAEFVAQEEMGRHRGFWWSPDGAQLLVQRSDSRGVERFYIQDPLQVAKKPRPWPYPRAGKRNVDVRLGLIKRGGGRMRWLRWDAARYPYLAYVTWPRRGRLTLVVQDRAQQETCVLAADVRRLQTRVLHCERDTAWVNLDRKMPRWLDDGSGFLWSSEAAGGWELQLRAPNGKLKRVVVPRKLGYRGLADVDSQRGFVTVHAGNESSETHIYRVRIDGKVAPQRISGAAGEHHALFGRGHDVFVHRRDTLRGRALLVRRVGGEERGRLRDSSEAPPFSPRVEITRVGARQFRAAIVRPRGFRPDARYPVLVYVYGGPHYRTVRAEQHRYLLTQWIADHGFVVVSVDGRGTPGRGRSWERALKGHFGRVILADQVQALRALGARYRQLDLSRVGIFGWSYGGYMAALAVMRRPEIFHAAVAGAPVVDWLDYDSHYTERYGGMPAENAAGYRRSSLLTHAATLRRPLLLIHGTADDNVYFFHSLKLVRALLRARRPFDFLPLPGATHSVREAGTIEQLYGRLVAHFSHHLRRRSPTMLSSPGGRRR